jgi:hypothetical protein
MFQKTADEPMNMALSKNNQKSKIMSASMN